MNNNKQHEITKQKQAENYTQYIIVDDVTINIADDVTINNIDDVTINIVDDVTINIVDDVTINNFITHTFPYLLKEMAAKLL